MQINVNGQTYTRWEDVPADVRQQLAATLPDADKNGVPDLFEGNLGGLPTANAQAFTSISVNGQTVNSVGELPPEMQQLLHQAFGWAGPGAAAVPQPPGTPSARATPDAPWPLQPGEVMLNGVPTVVGDSVEVKKPWWKRFFGG